MSVGAPLFLGVGTEALDYNILPPTVDYAIGLEKLSANGEFSVLIIIIIMIMMILNKN